MRDGNDLGITYLNIQDLAYPTAVDDLLHLLEVRQVTAVISHKAGDARLFRDAVDTGTILIACRQRFLHIDGFSSLHGHDGVSGMAGRRSGHIDGIHVRIIDQLLGISIPLTDAVLDGIGT